MRKSAAEIAKEAQKREEERQAALTKRMPKGTAPSADKLPRIPDTKEEKSSGGGSGIGNLLGALGGGGGKKATTKKTNEKKTSTKKPVKVKANGKKTKTPSETTPDKTPAPTDETFEAPSWESTPESIEATPAWQRDEDPEDFGATPSWESTSESIEATPAWQRDEDPEDFGATPSWQDDTSWDVPQDEDDWSDSNWSWSWDDTGWKHGGRIKKAKKAKAESRKPRSRPALRGRRRELKGS